MQYDFQHAFEPDAPRELVEAVNRMCAEAEGIDANCELCGGTGRDLLGKWTFCQSCDGGKLAASADYVGDMNNLMRLREKAIAVDAHGIWFTGILQDVVANYLYCKTDDVDKHMIAAAPPWAILKAAYEVLKGDKNG